MYILIVRHNLLIWQRRFFLFVGQILQISTKFVLGNVIFSWQPLDYSAYYVQITRDTISDTWARVNSTRYTVRDVLLYDSISINVRTSGSADNNIETYNGNFKNFFKWFDYNINTVFVYFHFFLMIIISKIKKNEILILSRPTQTSKKWSGS